jgi:hypothetical protein
MDLEDSSDSDSKPKSKGTAEEKKTKLSGPPKKGGSSSATNKESN